MRTVFQLAAFVAAVVCFPGWAAEVKSPEQFMRENYGWTIQGIDGERGLFGKFRNFACFDDRLSPPRSDSDLEKRRWGTQCSTVRGSGENLAAMVFVSWSNKQHKKPITSEKYADSVARGMAGGKDSGGYEAKCTKSLGSAGGRAVDFYDCSMVLPFGTFFANFIHFEHRGIEYFVRAQNASNAPSQDGPREAVSLLVSQLVFDD